MLMQAGVVTFHGSQLAQKAGDRNFTEGNPVAVVINNGYLDPSNNASQLTSIQVSPIPPSNLGICTECLTTDGLHNLPKYKIW